MLTTLRHRGPDAEGYWHHANLALGHSRLSIVDLSDASAQPMQASDGRSVLIYNGEVHNYPELRDELRALGYRFRTSGDTEVVLAALTHWGVAAFEQFNGMWALAWWNVGSRQLVLSRDRFGIKPIYYSVRGDRVAFASEPKAILAGFPEERQPRLEEIYAYLQGAAPDVGDRTFFDNIHAVAPAHYVTFGPAESGSSRQYWKIGGDVNRTSFEGNISLFRDLLEDSVRIRLRSDAPLGAALSGGLDSSAVVGLAARNGVAPDCYSLRYSGAAYDESQYAAAVADHVGCSVRWVEPDGYDAVDLARKIVWHHDAPPPIRGRLPHWAVMRRASRDVRVMLEGTGSDELLAGYSYMLDPFLRDRAEALFAKRNWRGFAELAREIGRLNSVRGDALGFVSSQILRIAKRALRTAPWKQLQARDFREQFGAIDPIRKRGSWWSDSVKLPFNNRLDNALWLEFSFAGLPESLHGADAAGMAFSVESRAPFLDHRLVEFCFALPSSHKIRDGRTKAILRHALAGIIPEQVINRTVKLGFPAPYGEWLSASGSFEMIRDILISARTTARGVLDVPKLRRLLAPTHRGRAFTRRYVDSVWRMLSVELWFRQFIDQPLPGEDKG